MVRFDAALNKLADALSAHARAISITASPESRISHRWSLEGSVRLHPGTVRLVRAARSQRRLHIPQFHPRVGLPSRPVADPVEDDHPHAGPGGVAGNERIAPITPPGSQRTQATVSMDARAAISPCVRTSLTVGARSPRPAGGSDCPTCCCARVVSSLLGESLGECSSAVDVGVLGDVRQRHAGGGRPKPKPTRRRRPPRLDKLPGRGTRHRPANTAHAAAHPM